MNKATFEQAQIAYEAKDFASALDLYNQVVANQNSPLEAGEFGLVYHQIGNCYVKLQNYPDAISAYVNATTDQAYISLGTVFYNLGMAYAYMNDFGNAIKNFQIAINHQNYRAKYKAYTAMGNALMKSGKSANAADAFRNAAMDNHNPDPTRALLNLGVCFMALGSPEDAITVYLSTFQYNMNSDFRNRLNANLGQAYVACGQMQKAVEAFEESLRDKSYKLSDSASVDYQRAIGAVSKGAEELDPSLAGPTAAAAAGMAIGSVTQEANASQAPYDETITNAENNLVQQTENQTDDAFAKWTESTKDAAYKATKKKNVGKRVFVIIVLFLAACVVAGSVLFCFGFGFPTQEMICKQYFANPLESKDTCFSDELSNSVKEGYCAMASQDSNAEVLAVERSVNSSTCYVKAKTSEGMDVTYKIKMARSLLGWKIQKVDLFFASNQ